MNQCPVHFIQHGKLVRKQSRKLRVSNYDLTDFRSQVCFALFVKRIAQKCSVENVFITCHDKLHKMDLKSTNF